MACVHLALLLAASCASTSAVVQFDQENQGLTEIPSESFTPNITEVILDTNSISSIGDAAFASTPLLDTLSIKVNDLTFISSSAFAGTVLRVLKIIENQMTYIPDLSSVNLTLEEVHAQKNAISDIANLTGLVALKKVYLVTNLLAAVPPGLLFTLPSIVYLNLGKNSITTLEDLTPLGSQAVTFDIPTNPIDCNCSMVWVTRLPSTSVVLTGTCDSPVDLNGVDLNALNRSILCNEGGISRWSFVCVKA
jgi:Leucine-rich repeat (LRR) protein